MTFNIKLFPSADEISAMSAEDVEVWNTNNPDTQLKHFYKYKINVPAKQHINELTKQDVDVWNRHMECYDSFLLKYRIPKEGKARIESAAFGFALTNPNGGRPVGSKDRRKRGSLLDMVNRFGLRGIQTANRHLNHSDPKIAMAAAKELIKAMIDINGKDNEWFINYEDQGETKTVVVQEDKKHGVVINFTQNG